MTNPAHPVLVTGATGKTGRRVARVLTERGVAIRACPRAARPPLAWEERATWPAALAGAGAVHIASLPRLPRGGGRVGCVSAT